MRSKVCTSTRVPLRQTLRLHEELDLHVEELHHKNGSLQDNPNAKPNREIVLLKSSIAYQKDCHRNNKAASIGIFVIPWIQYNFLRHDCRK